MPAASAFLRIGSRGSPLALAQARLLRAGLASAHGVEPERIAISVIRTTGDVVQDRPLSEVGNKGLFTKEIEQALADGAIDIAVHSAKDMLTELPPGLVLAGCLPREDARDVFVSPGAPGIAGLALGATVGTASLRRGALVRRLRRDVAIVPLRGNVETRLRKLADGIADATVLALAGLKRLGLADVATEILDLDAFPPAVGQGAIALETREADTRTRDLVAAIDDADTTCALVAERAFLAVLDGSCKTPIAGHARVAGNEIGFHGLIVRPDGSEAFETTPSGARADAVALGADAGRELRSRGGPGFFDGR